MKYEGVNFNAGYWSTKTEAEFLEHEKHHGIPEKKMKEIFTAMQPKRGKDANDKKTAE